MTNGLLIYGEILRISSCIRKPFLIATAPLWISLYMRKTWISFLSVMLMLLHSLILVVTHLPTEPRSSLIAIHQLYVLLHLSPYLATNFLNVANHPLTFHPSTLIAVTFLIFLFLLFYCYPNVTPFPLFLLVSLPAGFLSFPSLTLFWLTKVGSDCVWFEAQ